MSRSGGDRVLLGLSGGVDSSVVAALLHRAIGDQLVCVFVDHGLLRAAEGDQVMTTFAENMGVQRDPGQRRATVPRRALRGVADPEDKRKIIGRLFVEVFEEEAHKLEGVRWLAQGTIYPDVIESAGASTGKAHVIKSHHNVGGLPEQMKLEAWSSRCASCSRTRCAGSGSSSVCRARWCSAIRSRARVSVCGSSAK